jgi:hypothetical protein
METEGSALERNELVSAELDREKFDTDTEGRTAGTIAATSPGAETAGGFGASATATLGAATTGIFRGIAGFDPASSARLTGAVGAAGSDIFSSNRSPAWLFPFVAVMRTGTEPELAIHRIPSTCAIPEASV